MQQRVVLLTLSMVCVSVWGKTVPPLPCGMGPKVCGSALFTSNSLTSDGHGNTVCCPPGFDLTTLNHQCFCSSDTASTIISGSQGVKGRSKGGGTFFPEVVNSSQFQRDMLRLQASVKMLLESAGRGGNGGAGRDTAPQLAPWFTYKEFPVKEGELLG